MDSKVALLGHLCYLVLSQAIMGNFCLSWNVLGYIGLLSQAVLGFLGYLELSRATFGYLGLSRTIWSYLGLSQDISGYPLSTYSYLMKSLTISGYISGLFILTWAISGYL